MWIQAAPRWKIFVASSGRRIFRWRAQASTGSRSLQIHRPLPLPEFSTDSTDAAATTGFLSVLDLRKAVK
jgi:hypothetical protein